MSNRAHAKSIHARTGILDASETPCPADQQDQTDEAEIGSLCRANLAVASFQGGYLGLAPDSY
jgi:hypothetical protein